ncbi:Synaptotagmin-4 [Glycine soja]
MVTSTQLKVKNIGFTGVFRLIFNPLVDEFPAFGTVYFSLKEKRDLDFTLKVIGGDLSTLPGISDAIEETIRDAIEDSITWPVRKVIPILPGDYSNLELKPVGILEVKLVQAKNLTNKDIIGKSDPYAVIFVRPLRDRTKTSKIMHLTVYSMMKAFRLLNFLASLKDLEPGKVKDVWLKLVKDLEVHRDNKYRGEVHVELSYTAHLESKAPLRTPFDRDFSLTTFEKTLKSGTGAAEADDLIGSRRRNNVIARGVLSVTVISAEDLPAVDLMGKADPFVVLMLKKTEKKKLKTRVLNESLNPVWNQTFDFVVEDGLHEMLILEVYDHDTFGKEKIGRVILTLTKVILEGEYNETYPLDGAKSGNISLHLKSTPQHKFRDP